MHFTVIFAANEDRDYSYGLVFVPNAVWVQGDRHIINLTPETPHYTPGGVKRLLNSERPDLSHASRKSATIIAHANGNGTHADLAELMRDLEIEGFSVTLLRLPDPHIVNTNR
jgi:hypothetical protein